MFHKNYNKSWRNNTIMHFSFRASSVSFMEEFIDLVMYYKKSEFLKFFFFDHLK